MKLMLMVSFGDIFTVMMVIVTVNIVLLMLLLLLPVVMMVTISKDHDSMYKPLAQDPSD